MIRLGRRPILGAIAAAALPAPALAQPAAEIRFGAFRQRYGGRDGDSDAL